MVRYCTAFLILIPLFIFTLHSPLCKKRFDKWLDIKPAKKSQATRQVYGSQDAYNLFYVEQTYLARHAKDELSQCMIRMLCLMLQKKQRPISIHLIVKRI